MTHTPRPAGALGTSLQSNDALGQSPAPLFGSLMLHAGPRSGNALSGVFAPVKQAARHAEPGGPTCVVVAADTQQASPLGQSLALVQATHPGLGHSMELALVHRFIATQQTYGELHGVTVQSPM
jgi:hypothetical protein